MTLEPEIGKLFREQKRESRENNRMENWWVSDPPYGLTNMRAANADKEIRLTTPTHLSLEEAIEYLSNDELLEVTPLAYRIRKQILSAHDRGKMNKSAKKAALEAEG